MKAEELLSTLIAGAAGLTVREVAGVHGVAGFLIFIAVFVALSFILPATLFKEESSLRRAVGFLIFAALAGVYAALKSGAL